MAGVVAVIKSTARRVLALLMAPQTTRLLGEPFFWFMGMRGKGQAIDLSQVKHMLIIRLDAMGDLVMTTSFLRELRRNCPSAQITLIVSPSVTNLVECCPYVNEVLTYEWKTSGRLSQLRRHGRALSLGWKYLWSHHFDLAIIPRWDADCYHAIIVAYFSGAKWRVGYSEKVNEVKKQVNRGYDVLLTDVLHDNDLKHEVEHNLDVIRFLGGTIHDDRLEVWVSPEEEIFVKQFLSHFKVCSDELLIGFGPGAGESKRMWPISKFGELGDWLGREYHARIIIFGTQEEKPLGEALQLQLENIVINLAGQTTLRQVAALLRLCRLYIGNDSGIMHLAVAAGVPVVEISCHPLNGSQFHPHSPKRFGPWGVPHSILQPLAAQRPCFDACTALQAHCILGITIEQVKKTVAEHLSLQSKVFKSDVRKG